MSEASSQDHAGPPIEERISRPGECISMLTASLADSLLEAVEQTVHASGEFIDKFKELSQKLNLPGSDQEFQTLNRAESLLLTRLEAARHLANCLAADPRLASRAAAAEEIAAILRQVRRARLFLQLKIFRVDRILDQQGTAPRSTRKTVSAVAGQRKKRQQLH